MAKDARLYARFTLDFTEHPKIAILSDSAFRCLVDATLYSRRMLTDGFLARRLALARWLLADLHELSTNDTENPSLIEREEGWYIHDFALHQDTKADIEARRKRAETAGQKGGLAKAKQVAKRTASKSLSKPLSKNVAETETKTYISSGYVNDEELRTERDPLPPEPPPDPYDSPPERVVIDNTPAHIDNAAKPAKQHPTEAAKTLVRQELGANTYPRQTIDRLAVQVDKLARQDAPDIHLRASVREWDKRPDCNKPEFLPTVYSDVVKRARADPVANGHPVAASDAAFARTQALKGQPRRLELT